MRVQWPPVLSDIDCPSRWRSSMRSCIKWKFSMCCVSFWWAGRETRYWETACPLPRSGCKQSDLCILLTAVLSPCRSTRCWLSSVSSQDSTTCLTSWFGGNSPLLITWCTDRTRTATAAQYVRLTPHCDGFPVKRTFSSWFLFSIYRKSLSKSSFCGYCRVLVITTSKWPQM